MKTDFSQYVLPTNDPGQLSFLSRWCQQATRKPRLPKLPRVFEGALPPDSLSCPSSSCFALQSVTHSFHLRAAAAALHSDTTSPAPHSPNPGFFFRVSRRRPGARREATPDGPILSVQDAPPPQTKALSGDRGPGGGSAPRPDLSCNPDLSGNRCRSWRRSARTENPVRSTPVPRPAHRRQERQSVLREHRAWPERASWDPKYL